MAERKRKRLIALLTDFGLSDQYVGVVKGVIAGIDPDLRIVDISHAVPPQNIDEARYLLWASAPHFPADTLFLVVVDPGVGTSRAIVVAEAGRRMFVAPDNGVLDMALSGHEQVKLWRLDKTNEKKWKQYARKEISATFHGRDIFAPIAAHLAAGVPPSKVGSPAAWLSPPSPFVEKGGTSTRILHIDRFGNVVTSVPCSGALAGFRVKVGRRWIDRWTSSYADAPEGEPVLLCGSSRLVEIVVREGNAALLLGAAAGMECDLVWG